MSTTKSETNENDITGGEMKPPVAREHPDYSPLSIHNMTVAYHRKPVLWDVDYDAPKGKLIAIVGPNGSGKTTLIKGVMGLIPVASGEVKFFGDPIKKNRDRVAYVPQRNSVDWDFPINALQVAAMGVYHRIGWFGRVSRKYRKMAREALDRVGMADFAERQISQLSGGQQQRVFLARALAQEADLYLMDEPFVGVDAATERAIVDILRTIREQGKTAIVVHHDLQTIQEYFDEVILLNMRLVATGTVEEAFTVENLRKTFGGKLALLDQVGLNMQITGGQ